MKANISIFKEHDDVILTFIKNELDFILVSVTSS